MKLGYEIIENVGSMLKESKGLTYTYVRQELGRFANRFKKRLARERMQGPPGIRWYNASTLKNSKHFKYYVEGDSLKKLAMVSRISGILMAHETGAVIKPRRGEWLYIIDRRKKWAGAPARKWRATQSWSATSGIVAKVKQVEIKPRLGFRNLFNTMVPEARGRLQSAMNNALKVARERATTRTIQMATKL